MIYTPLTIKAMCLAYSAHEGQYDKTGLPYIFHPYHLAEQMPDEITTCVALLHDVVEDTYISMDHLQQDFPDEVTQAVRLLTHDPDVTYFDYINAIKSNNIARIVKLADLEHNLDDSRFAGQDLKPSRDSQRKRYEKAKSILSDGDKFVRRLPSGGDLCSDCSFFQDDKYFSG